MVNKVLKKAATADKKEGKIVKAKSGYRRGALTVAIYSYFDQIGVDNAKYEGTEKVAKKALPTTKFNKYHLSWYKNKYKELGGKGKWNKVAK